MLISGEGSNLQAIIDACDKGSLKAKICAVISNKANAFGLVRAKKANIATYVIEPHHYQTKKLYDEALMQCIDSYQPKLILLAGFMRILSADFVEQYPQKILNIHPSLLPKYKGLHTHQRVLEANEKMHGCTVHFVTKALDDGEIILQASVPILSNDDAQSLAKRVQKKEHEIYVKAVQLVLNTDA